MKYLITVLLMLALSGCDDRKETVKMIVENCPGVVSAAYTVSAFWADSVTVSCSTTPEQRRQNGKRD